MTHHVFSSGVVPPVRSFRTSCVAQSWLAFVLVLAPSVTAQPQPSWNRRVTGFAITPVAAGPAGTYDLEAEWRIDLEATTTTPVELGVVVNLVVDILPQGSVVSDDSLIWDIQSGTAFCQTAPDGELCGTATINGASALLACDANTGTCATPPFTASFSNISLSVGDEVTVILTPATGAEPETQTDDDTGTLFFGTWNRRLISLNIIPTPGAPTGTYDATAEVLIELTAGATVPLNLGIDTEPVGDPCCQEACCCPSCAKECQGSGCGGGSIECTPPSLASLCGTCSGQCAQGEHDGTPFLFNCDAVDCGCRSETITLQWFGLSLDPGAEVYLNLRVAEGALPELQTDDDVIITIAPDPTVPTVSAWGLMVMTVLVLTAGTLVLRRRSVRA